MGLRGSHAGIHFSGMDVFQDLENAARNLHALPSGLFEPSVKHQSRGLLPQSLSPMFPVVNFWSVESQA